MTVVAGWNQGLSLGSLAENIFLIHACSRDTLNGLSLLQRNHIIFQDSFCQWFFCFYNSVAVHEISESSASSFPVILMLGDAQQCFKCRPGLPVACEGGCVYCHPTVIVGLMSNISFFFKHINTIRFVLVSDLLWFLFIIINVSLCFHLVI